MNRANGENLTDGERVALGILADLHQQNQTTSNPMLAELEPVSGINSRWALVVASLLALNFTVEGWKNTNSDTVPKAATTEKQPGWHVGHSIDGK